MTQSLSAYCCVCGVRDVRALVDVMLVGGAHATLCGSHAIMHTRLSPGVRSEPELRELLCDRRGRRDRRQPGDELGVALEQAFSDQRRERDRRRA
jgi:hypothetical protein